MAIKTITYRRAVWLEAQRRSLAEFVTDAKDALPIVEDRKVIKSDGQILKCLRFGPIGVVEY